MSPDSGDFRSDVFPDHLRVVTLSALPGPTKTDLVEAAVVCAPAW
jgi:hypothetical protein